TASLPVRIHRSDHTIHQLDGAPVAQPRHLLVPPAGKPSRHGERREDTSRLPPPDAGSSPVKEINDKNVDCPCRGKDTRYARMRIWRCVEVPSEVDQAGNYCDVQNDYDNPGFHR